jgi:2,3-bisphosphoglycerate-dependent phosphoglycerate mutase
MKRQRNKMGEDAGLLLLVKHSLPEIERQATASQWRLSTEGRRRCWPLAEELAPYTPDLIVCSQEPKAVETAQIVGDQLAIPVYSLSGLHEHERRTVPFLSRQELEACAAKLFANPSELVFGEETAEQAGERFSRAISATLAQHGGQTLAIISHGTVITLFVSRTNRIESFSFWKSLGLPSLVVLRLPGLGLDTIVEEIA